MRGKAIAAIAVFGALLLSAGAMQAQSTSTTTAPIDINTASRTELASAGWGQYADAIIAARPYKSMNDLVERKVVPQKAYDKGSEKFQIGNGSATPMAEPTPTPVNPAVTPDSLSTTPTAPPSVTPGATGTGVPVPAATPGTPAAPSPAGTAAPSK